MFEAMTFEVLAQKKKKKSEKEWGNICIEVKRMTATHFELSQQT